jgi:tetratricopeptide (TPR) repeat protein
MSRRSRTRGLAVCGAVLAATAAAPADEVAEYLRHHGLHRLLAVHLEQQLPGVGGEARQALMLELAGIYAQLLESTKDPGLLADLEKRSHRLLAAAPASVGEELRLALLRGAYRGAEGVAERHRLRQSDQQELARARETLSEIIPRLTTLRRQIEGRLRQTESRLMRSGGSAATELARQAEEIQGLLTQCTFLTAWALYYQSWLNDRPDNARAAEDLFAEVLSAESPRPRPQDISVDLRGLEAMARSILGMGLCKSLTSSSATAIEWLDLLEHERAYEGLRAELPAWKMAVHLEHGEYRAARAILLSAGDGTGQEPLAWIRLAAVHALEAEHRNVPAAELARLAVAMLAARGELAEVLDLAARYGTGALGEEGFAFRYVRGVQHYDRARAAHGHDEPAADAATVALYGQAIEEFERALGETDAQRYPEAAASCRWLIGWCRFFQGRFLAAREAFERAVDHLGPDEAPEAMWMAIVCLDKAVVAGGDQTHARAMSDLIDEALARYPLSPRASKLKLKRALHADPSPEVVEELLDIPAGAEVYGAARRRAAQILYQLFRQASGDQRLAYGNEYLAVALPLLGAAADELDHTDLTAVEEYVGRGRRVLEVALADGIERATAAGTVLADFDDLAVRDGVDLSAQRDEIDCRRVQQFLLIDDAPAAEKIADRLWGRDPDSIWTRVAERALFQFGAEHGDLRLVIRHGLRILEEFEGQPQMLSDRRVLAYHATVAEAMHAEARRGGDLQQARQALDLYERLLAVAPTDATFLRAAAELSQRLGETDQALRCWRTLVAGSTVGTEAWYEARFHLIALLAEVDPPRARAVMDQHKQLNPEYGPEPWASRMRQLDLRIPAPDRGGMGKRSLPVEAGRSARIARANKLAHATHQGAES